MSRKIASVISPHDGLRGQLRDQRAAITVLSPLSEHSSATPALRTLTAVVQAWVPETHLQLNADWDLVFRAGHLSCLAQTSHLQLTRVEIVVLLPRGAMIYLSDVYALLPTLAASPVPITRDLGLERSRTTDLGDVALDARSALRPPLHSHASTAIPASGLSLSARRNIVPMNGAGQLPHSERQVLDRSEALAKRTPRCYRNGCLNPCRKAEAFTPGGNANEPRPS